MEDFRPLESGNTKTGTKKRSGCGGIALVVILGTALVLAGVGWWKYYYTYSEGFRSGLLQKFSHKGNISKTYEG